MKGALTGGTCIAHGGGPRCKVEGCGKGALNLSCFCSAHEGEMDGLECELCKKAGASDRRRYGVTGMKVHRKKIHVDGVCVVCTGGRENCRRAVGTAFAASQSNEDKMCNGCVNFMLDTYGGEKGSLVMKILTHALPGPGKPKIIPDVNTKELPRADGTKFHLPDPTTVIPYNRLCNEPLILCLFCT